MNLALFYQIFLFILSDRDLDLQMRLNNDKCHGYIWNCNLIYEIGKIEPKSVLSIKLNIVPYRTGLLVSETNELLKLNFSLICSKLLLFSLNFRRYPV